MTQPGLVARLAGTPWIALLLFAGAGLVVYEWYVGQIVWWLAAAAVLCSLRTVSAMARLRRYKAWAAEWQAMGAIEGTASPPPKRRRWKLAVISVLLLLAVPVLSGLPTVQANTAVLNGLRCFWLLLALYWFVRLIKRIFGAAKSRLGQRREASVEKAMEATIEFAIGRASECPTRASAERGLPDYCLRLMGLG
jgi:hypothetical protein